MARPTEIRDVTYYEASNSAECLRALRRAKHLEPQQVVDAVNGSHSLLGNKPIDMQTYVGWENGIDIPSSYHGVLKAVLAPDKGRREVFDRNFGSARKVGDVPVNDLRAGGHSVFADRLAPLPDRVARINGDGRST